MMKKIMKPNKGESSKVIYERKREKLLELNKLETIVRLIYMYARKAMFLMVRNFQVSKSVYYLNNLHVRTTWLK